jgi:addiction module HigA family antidote
MADDTRRPYWPNTVLHPGDTVVDYLEAYEWTQRELARRSGLTPKTISEICSGKAPISPATALALENVFLRPAHFWLNLQRIYDEHRAREAARSVKGTWLEWAKSFPVKELKTLGFLPENGDVADSLLGFFGVSSPESWNAVFNDLKVSYRQTQRYEVSRFAVAAWIRATEIEASKIEVSPYDPDKLLQSLERLKRISRGPVDSIVSSVQGICGQAGVAVVWVPALNKTGISGCARWVSDKRALVALTLRYKTDDQMWFTFFHELGHVLLHRKRYGFILDNAAALGDDYVDPGMRQQEDEANQFAADTLISPPEFARFVDAHLFTSEAIYAFAERVGVSTGIVVGRLQREKLLRPEQGNMLKRKLMWHNEEGDPAE